MERDSDMPMGKVITKGVWNPIRDAGKRGRKNFADREKVSNHFYALPRVGGGREKRKSDWGGDRSKGETAKR